MFTISSTPLEHIDLRRDFLDAQAGAMSSFEGWVRNHNNGKKVTELEYEAYVSLCESEARKIFNEMYDQFNIITARAYHRVGKLRIGEMAVWVGVLAEHRDDSFKACRYLIDEIKSRLPIWKKETYADGISQWVACHACSTHKESIH